MRTSKGIPYGTNISSGSSDYNQRKSFVLGLNKVSREPIFMREIFGVRYR